MTQPFNAAFHEFMLARGAKYERVDAYWEDDGDAENGPHLVGYNDYDLYTESDYRYRVTEDGEFDCEPRDLEHERYIEETEARCGTDV